MRWLVGLLVAGVLSGCAQSSMHVSENESISRDMEVHAPEYEEDFYLPALARLEEGAGMQGVIGGVVPHHLLAADMMARFFATVSASMPDVIVLLVPDHDEQALGLMSAGYMAWQTPFGMVRADEGLVEGVGGLKVGHNSLEVVKNEMAVKDMMPWFAAFFADLPVVPVTISKGVDMDGVDEMVALLHEASIDRDVMVIASVDFSHYLPTHEAYEHDEETWEWMRDKEYDRLMQANSDYLDSPAAVLVLLKFAEMKDASLDLLERGNAGDILEDPGVMSTGYITAVVKGE